MKAGRIEYAPDPRLWSSEAHEGLYDTVCKEMFSEIHRVEKEMFQDELLYGISGCHVSADGEMKRLDPATVEDIIHKRNTEDKDQYTGVTKMSIEEIIERYPLTEEQIIKLKEYGKDREI